MEKSKHLAKASFATEHGTRDDYSDDLKRIDDMTFTAPTQHPSHGSNSANKSLTSVPQHVSRKTTGDALFKVILLGDSHVGKSSIVMRLVDEQFSLEHQPTLGFDFSFKKMVLDAYRQVTLQVVTYLSQLCLFSSTQLV
jgi:Ras family